MSPPTVEDHSRVDLRRLVKYAGPHPAYQGTLRWSDGSSVRYHLVRAGERGALAVWWSAEGRAFSFSADLVTTAQKLGGRRWWCLCPRCGRRCAVLLVAAAADALGCRVCLAVGYRSQRERGYQRLTSKCENLRRRYGGPPSLLAPWADKPKGMHWRTWEVVSTDDLLLRRAALLAVGRRFGVLG